MVPALPHDSPTSMVLQHLFWLLVLTIGNCELLATIVNRTHALRIHEAKLRHIRHVHDLLIPLFPSWLIVVIGFTAPGIFLEPIPPGETWQRLSLIVQCYFGLCFAGFGGFCWSMLRYWLYRTPRQQIAFASDVVDVAEVLGAPPVGIGPYQSLTRLPLNECFQIEWTTRTFELDRLPPEWDELSILHLTDLHMMGTIDRTYFEYLAEQASEMDVDMIVFTGDLLDRQECVEWLPATFGRLQAPLGQYFILGNHDWYLDSDAIRHELVGLGWRDLSGSLQVLDVSGAPLAIGGSERPWLGQHPTFHSVPDHVFRLLLSHTPDNLSWARRQGVDLMLTGHNHGGQVVLPGIGPVYSPSLHGVRFAAGVFWYDPTLLFVSRGVSGCHPLRIGARPEVSRLILKSKSRSH